MPAPGDQHDATVNPFEETKHRVSQFTATEIATLQSRLEKQLGPEYLSARSGPSGQRVHYVPAEKCIALANDVFGFNGWSSGIQNIQVDFVDENTQTGKISLGLSVIVRVTLRDGTFHEDIGYGHIENCKGKAAAFEKAKKEGTTDGLKRALRNFGNVLGNCIYDKDYLAKVTKMKVAPTRFDEDNLHRHSDFAKKEPVDKSEVKPETSTEVEKSSGGKRVATTVAKNVSVDSLDDDFGDFDEADFGVAEGGHPDEVILSGPHGTSTSDKPQPASSGSDQDRAATNHAYCPPRQMHPPPRTMATSSSNGNPPPRQQPHTPQPANRPGAPVQGRPNQQPSGRPSFNQNQAPSIAANMNLAQQAASNSKPTTPAAANGGAPTVVGFLSARSADLLPKDAVLDVAPVAPSGAKPFDPRADSPSIRKTAGIDHRTSKPVGRNGQHVEIPKRDEKPPVNLGGGFSTGHGNALAPSPSARPTNLANVVNPALNQARQIGAPGGAGPFRQPMKRPVSVTSNAGSRTPLNEVTTNGMVGTAPGVGDAIKRQKMT